jgi:NAD(P)-dependent dehydrogenase (short-subunit alcohol dehydrogenase family)
VSADAWCGHVGGELRSAFLAVKQAAAAIRAKGGGGSVVIVAPAASDHRSYDALQQGLRLLVRAAALELGPEDIRVNIVIPGAGETPLGRPCAPEDIAASVAFVASPRARFMTGADLVVDGGRLAE